MLINLLFLISLHLLSVTYGVGIFDSEPSGYFVDQVKALVTEREICSTRFSVVDLLCVEVIVVDFGYFTDPSLSGDGVVLVCRSVAYDAIADLKVVDSLVPRFIHRVAIARIVRRVGAFAICHRNMVEAPCAYPPFMMIFAFDLYLIVINYRLIISYRSSGISNYLLMI